MSRFMSAGIAAVAAASLVACSESSVSPTSRSESANDLSVSLSAQHAEVIPGRFIVTLTDDARPDVVAADHGVKPDFVYTHALNGFAGSMSEAARAGLLRDARVSRVEP